MTGGLGPTQDDLTREAIALVAGVPLVRRPELEAMLREKFRGFSGRSMPENNLQQADVPEGARAVVPERGTAPGLVVDLPGGVRLYAMAGVPLEMVEIMEGTVLPELATRTGAALVSRILRVTGMGESAVAEALADLFDASTNPTVAFLATGGEVKVRLTAKAATHEEAERRIAPLADEVAARLGDVVFSTRDESLEGTVLRLLVEQGLTICTAESLTGGSVSARLTGVPGASAAVVGGVVAYSAPVKRDVLGVAQATLEGDGVVSEACAREMAAGARRLLGADVSLALTGVAGPEPHGGEEPGADLDRARGSGRDPRARLPRSRGSAIGSCGGPSRPGSTSSDAPWTARRSLSPRPRSRPCGATARQGRRPGRCDCSSRSTFRPRPPTRSNGRSTRGAPRSRTSGGSHGRTGTSR